MRIRATLLTFLFVPSSRGQVLSHEEICRTASDAVVAIAIGDSHATGFLISSDGYLLTNDHVVRSHADGQLSTAISVRLPHGRTGLAKMVAGGTPEAVGNDFAVLKVDGFSDLPHLDLASGSNAGLGAPVTIIGFPFSAIGPNGDSIESEFCLSGSVAAFATITRNVELLDKKGSRRTNIPASVIYFEAPSVKGLSGSPLLDARGQVVGILSTKLTGISADLEQSKAQLERGVGIDMISGTFSFTQTMRGVVETLDNQLANGLGSAIAIDVPRNAFDVERARSSRARRKPIAATP